MTMSLKSDEIEILKDSLQKVFLIWSKTAIAAKEILISVEESRRDMTDLSAYPIPNQILSTSQREILSRLEFLDLRPIIEALENVAIGDIHPVDANVERGAAVRLIH